MESHGNRSGPIVTYEDTLILKRVCLENPLFFGNDFDRRLVEGLVSHYLKEELKAPMTDSVLELGDDDVKQERALVDPRLRCSPGAFFLCNSNEGLRDKGTGNGTQCRLLHVKLNDDATSYTCKIWNKRKVWTVCANDVKYLEFEHFPKTQEIKKLELLLEKNNKNRTRQMIMPVKLQLTSNTSSQN